MNPLKRKLVDHPKDWPWTSFCFNSNLKNGLLRVDHIHEVADTEMTNQTLRPFDRLRRSGHLEVQERVKRWVTRPASSTLSGSPAKRISEKKPKFHHFLLLCTFARVPAGAF